MGKTIDIAHVYLVVVGTGVIRIIGICYLRITQHDHLIIVFLATGKLFQFEIIPRNAVLQRKISTGCTVGFGVRRDRAVCRNGIVDKASFGITIERIMPMGIGLHTGVTIADNNTLHRMPLVIG